MKKLLLYTTSAGELYNSFALLYIYSAHVLYPDYETKVRIWDDDISHYQSALNSIGLNPDKIKQINPEYEKTLRNIKATRWLYDPEDIQDYDFVYTGDVDFIFTPAYPKILEHNLKHCLDKNLCYSNLTRPPHYRNNINVNMRRLRGLHFFKTKEYIAATLPYIQSVQQKIRVKDYSFFEHDDCPIYTKIFPISDEQFLYNIVEKSGLFIDHDDNWAFNEAGLHVGRFRGLKSEERFRGDHIDGNHFLSLYDDDEKFQKLLEFCCPKAKDIINFMAADYKRNLR